MAEPMPTPTVDGQRRRPQWKGERRAVLVRLPAGLAERLRAEAADRRQSVSDTANELILGGLDAGRGVNR